MKDNHIKTIAFMGIFVALEIILTRFLSIQTPIVRIGFTFLPIAMSAIMFGPLFSGVAAALADIMGMMLFPSGMYFPGFTFTTFLTGIIYGSFLYKRPLSFALICFSVITAMFVVTLGLDTLWIYMITGQAFLAILPARIFKCIIMAPIQVLMIQVVWRYVIGQLDSSVITNRV